MSDPPRIYVGVAAVHDLLFVVGGLEKGSGEARMVTVFDTKAGAWQTLDPLPAGFERPNVAGVGDKLYILGALESKQVLAYDVVQHTWSTKAAVPVDVPRGNAAVGVHCSKILLAGGAAKGLSDNGLNTGVRQKDFLSYDTATDTWEHLPDLALARGYAMGAVVGNLFWMIGGSSGVARTDETTSFDLTRMEWTDQPPPPLSVSSAGISVLGGRIYLLGGIATSSGMIGPGTFVLDPVKTTRDKVTPMTTPRFAMGAATIGGRIYVPSGVAAVGRPDNFQPVSTFEVFVP
jgi:N-acetylneuraminic acid mutarotase